MLRLFKREHSCESYMGQNDYLYIEIIYERL